jgi:hypothetical protein
MGTNILKRNQPGNQTQDPNSIANLEYNQAAGAQKVAEVGRHLVPLPTPGVGDGYTTNLSGAAYALPSAGCNLAVYNNSNTVQAITFGMTSAVTALSAGAVDTNGDVGLPCTPNSWSYFAAGYNNWVISGSASLLVFLINDNTSIQVQAPGIQNNYGFPGSQQ